MSLSLLRQARIGRALRRVEVAHHIVGRGRLIGRHIGARPQDQDQRGGEESAGKGHRRGSYCGRYSSPKSRLGATARQGVHRLEESPRSEPIRLVGRTEQRRVGNEWVSTWRSRWAAAKSKKK